MKNLANCKPSEFFKQTVKIRKSVESWLKATQIMDIRKNVPQFEPNTPKEEIEKKLKEAIHENGIKMFESIFESNADKTLELLALVNFLEPEEVDNYEMSEYLKSLGEMLSNENVISFFASLMPLIQMFI